MQKRKITIASDIASDPAFIAKLVQAANEFDSKVYLECNEKCLNAKSIMGMMSLRVNTGDKIDIIADGQDEGRAIEKIEEFLRA